MPLRIPYESDGFPAARGFSSYAELSTTWDELLWASVTVGRPNRQFVFRHGLSSDYEALFRWSLVRMALEQRGLSGFRLYRTPAAKSLDPSEKGAVNYFLGLAVCKLFAARLLDAPWVLHLDVFGQQLSVKAALKSRSRPDLIGQDGASAWHAFECKGRVSAPDARAKAKAKAQAQRIVSVSGSACQLHVGTVAYFRGDTLHFYWRDPEPTRADEVRIDAPSDMWRWYYAPVRNALGRENIDYTASGDVSVSIEQADVTLRVHHLVAELIQAGRWQEVRAIAGEAHEVFIDSGFQADGLAVIAGPTWNQRFDAREG